MHFKILYNFYFFHLIFENLDVLNFHQIFFYCYRQFHTSIQDLNTFLKNIHQKWKYHRKEKQIFDRFLIFLNIETSAKLKKLNSGISLLLCGEKSRASVTYCSLCIEKEMKKTKAWLRFLIKIPWRFLTFKDVFKWALKLLSLADTQRRYSRL